MAFANILRGAECDEMSVDLMRYVPEVPRVARRLCPAGHPDQRRYADFRRFFGIG